MKKLMQLITVAMGVFMILKGANAENGSYLIKFKEVGIDQLSAEVLLHTHKPDGQHDSKEMKVSWTEKLPIAKSACKVTGLIAMDDVNGQFERDVTAQANLEWSF